MAAFTIECPDWVHAALLSLPRNVPDEVRLAAASHWCQQGRLSVELAAVAAGLSHDEFVEELARREQLIRR